MRFIEPLAELLLPVRPAFWASFIQSPLKGKFVGQTFCYCLYDFKINRQFIIVLPYEGLTVCPSVDSFIRAFPPQMKPNYLRGETIEDDHEYALVSSSAVQWNHLKRNNVNDIDTFIILPVWNLQKEDQLSDRGLIAYEIEDITENYLTEINSLSSFHEVVFARYLPNPKKIVLFLTAKLNSSIMISPDVNLRITKDFNVYQREVRHPEVNQGQKFKK